MEKQGLTANKLAFHHNVPIYFLMFSDMEWRWQGVFSGDKRLKSIQFFSLFCVARDVRLLFDPECDFLIARLTVSFMSHLVRTG